MKTLAKTIIFSLLFILFAIFLWEGMLKSEEVECNKWKEWEMEGYINYYVADWQVGQCAQFGITFDSPVHITK